MTIRWKHIALLMLLIMSFASCSKDKYVNAIPKKVMAVAALDISQLAHCMNMDVPVFLHQCFGWPQTDDNGLDLTVPVYLFETQDGNFGLCAKMEDENVFQDFVDTKLVASKHKASKTIEWRKCRFSLYDDKWLMGWNDEALLMTGPIVAAQQREMQQQIASWLKQEEKQSVKASPLYANLNFDNNEAVGHLSLQALALPDDVAALFTMGLTRKDNPKQVHITIDMVPKDDKMLLYGKMSATKEVISRRLEEAKKLLRPVELDKVDDLNADAVVDIFLNIQGKDYLSYLRSNPALETVMTIANAAIDLDNVIRSIDGTCHIQSLPHADGHSSLVMTAPLAHTQWLKDVPYWKQSTPQGTTLTEQTTPEQRSKGEQHFMIRSQKVEQDETKTQHLHFGLYAPNRFYIGTDAPLAPREGDRVSDKRPSPAFEEIGHAKTAIVLNLLNLSKSQDTPSAAIVQRLLTPLTKNFHHLIYIYQ